MKKNEELISLKILEDILPISLKIHSWENEDDMVRGKAKTGMRLSLMARLTM